MILKKQMEAHVSDADLRHCGSECPHLEVSGLGLGRECGLPHMESVVETIYDDSPLYNRSEECVAFFGLGKEDEGLQCVGRPGGDSMGVVRQLSYLP